MRSKLIFSIYLATVSWLRQLYVSGRANKIITKFEYLEDNEEIVLQEVEYLEDDEEIVLTPLS